MFWLHPSGFLKSRWWSNSKKMKQFFPLYRPIQKIVVIQFSFEINLNQGYHCCFTEHVKDNSCTKYKYLIPCILFDKLNVIVKIPKFILFMLDLVNKPVKGFRPFRFLSSLYFFSLLFCRLLSRILLTQSEWLERLCLP